MIFQSFSSPLSWMFFKKFEFQLNFTILKHIYGKMYSKTFYRKYISTIDYLVFQWYLSAIVALPLAPPPLFNLLSFVGLFRLSFLCFVPRFSSDFLHSPRFPSLLFHLLLLPTLQGLHCICTFSTVVFVTRKPEIQETKIDYRLIDWLVCNLTDSRVFHWSEYALALE